MITTRFGEEEDDEDEKQGGPTAGDYQPPKDLTIPGETEPLPNDEQ